MRSAGCVARGRGSTTRGMRMQRAGGEHTARLATYVRTYACTYGLAPCVGQRFGRGLARRCYVRSPFEVRIWGGDPARVEFGVTIRVRGPRVRGMWGGDPGSLTPRVSNVGVAIRVRGPRDRPHGAKVSGPHPEFCVFYIIFLCFFRAASGNLGRRSAAEVNPGHREGSTG